MFFVFLGFEEGVDESNVEAVTNSCCEFRPQNFSDVFLLWRALLMMEECHSC
jgi:hypothetical protein